VGFFLLAIDCYYPLVKEISLMQVPNSLFSVVLLDGRSYDMLRPAYYEKLYRYIYSKKLDTSRENGGFTRKDYPDNGNEDTRYTQVTDELTEFDNMRLIFKDLNKVMDIASIVSPEDIRISIESLMKKEGDRLVRMATPKQLAAIHPSYTEFQLTPEQARALQDAGYPDRKSCIGKPLEKLNSIHGIEIAIAARLAAGSMTVAPPKPEQTIVNKA
jgi:hypothetical protein